MLNKSHVFFISLLLALWAIMLFIVGPLGNFPLNDDWMYAHTVQSVVVNHKYHVSDEYSPVLITQVYWGALFCLPAGFSFIALRLSVIVLGILCSVLIYLIFSKYSPNRLMAFICTLLVITNPIYVCLSNTFMTDIPFLTFSIICIYFCLRSIEKPTVINILIAMALAIPAVLTRQFGMILPIALALTSIAIHRKKFVMYLLYLVPAGLIAWLLVFTIGRLQSKGWYPYNGNTITDFFSSPDFFLHLYRRLCLLPFYSGLFLLPLLLVKGNPLKTFSTKQKRIALITTGIFAVPLLIGLRWMPWGNIANILHLGPLTLKDENDITLSKYYPLVYIIRGVTFAATILLLLNLWEVLFKLKNTTADFMVNQKLFIALCAIGYGVLVCVPDFFFDRYVLYLLPLLIILLMPTKDNIAELKKPALYLSGIIAALFAFYAIAGTHDYLAWNQQRWKAGDYLTKEQNISIKKIDAGYEYNGWYNGVWQSSPPGKSWWFVNDDEYVVSSAPQPGYTIIKTFTYSSYLHFERGYMYVWHRVPK